MCWACYTPLTGQAPLGAGLAASVATAGAMPKPAGAPVGVPQTQAPEKKALDPKMIGVGAFLLIGGLAAVMLSGVLGGSSTSDTIALPGPETPFGEPGLPPQLPSTGVAPPVLTPGVSGGPGVAAVAVPAPFRTIASPSAASSTGTMGILMVTNSSPAGAAKFAKDQISRNGRWKSMQVAVFVDKATADAFGEYQRSRKNEALTSADFKRLAAMGVWDKTPAFLYTRGRQEKTYQPFTNPNSWWPVS